MALRNAFGNLATEDAVKKLHSSQVDGSQRTRVIPATGGGLTVYKNTTLGRNGINIKSKPGQVYGWFLFNQATSFRYVKLYNKASTPSVGHDIPYMTIPLPPGGGANVSFTSGINFNRGIGIGATSGVGDKDTSPAGANKVIVNIIYY